MLPNLGGEGAEAGTEQGWNTCRTGARAVQEQIRSGNRAGAEMEQNRSGGWCRSWAGVGKENRRRAKAFRAFTLNAHFVAQSISVVNLETEK